MSSELSCRYNGARKGQILKEIPQSGSTGNASINSQRVQTSSSINNYIQHNVNNAVTAKISMTGVHYDRGTCACSVGMVHSSRHLCTTWPVFLLLLIIPATNVANVGVWKSSSLVLLYHGREERPPEDFYPLRKVRDGEGLLMRQRSGRGEDGATHGCS